VISAIQLGRKCKLQFTIRSRFLCIALAAFFNAHVFEFTGFEDFATFQALHKFRIFVAAYDLHTWVLARLLLRVLSMRGRL